MPTHLPQIGRRPAKALLGGLALALAAAACGSDGGGVDAEGAWARTSPMMADAAAAYMVLSSDEAVSLVSASVPSDVAGRVEFHETVPVDEADGHDHDDEHGDHDDEHGDHEMEDGEMGEMAMTMQPIDTIDISAGGEVTLEPGGLHLMMLDLPDPLEEGETFDVTFTDDAGEEFTVSVEVRSEAP